MENKEEYYTPELESLHIGYELEYQTLVRTNEETYDKVEKWEKITLTKENFDSNKENWYNPYNLKIRTKYLSKEDIESEGWEFQDVKSNNFTDEKHEVYKEIS